MNGREGYDSVVTRPSLHSVVGRIIKTVNICRLTLVAGGEHVSDIGWIPITLNISCYFDKLLL